MARSLERAASRHRARRFRVPFDVWGGRISLFEPINRLMFPELPDEFFLGYSVGPVGDLAAKLKASEGCSDGESTLLDFDERDLFGFAADALFRNINLDLHRDTTHVLEPMAREAFLASSPNPLAPTHDEAIDRALSATERRRLERHLRPLVESGDRTRRLALAHLRADKAG